MYCSLNSWIFLWYSPNSLLKFGRNAGFGHCES
nr:MAG TPA: hypothetical protein [Caudoviricetes sp.]